MRARRATTALARVRKVEINLWCQQRPEGTVDNRVLPQAAEIPEEAGLLGRLLILAAQQPGVGEQQHAERRREAPVEHEGQGAGVLRLALRAVLRRDEEDQQVERQPDLPPQTARCQPPRSAKK
eukprot:COSAG04_NODE_1443_length_6735_cov_6.847348_6_plen_124_part_00